MAQGKAVPMGAEMISKLKEFDPMSVNKDASLTCKRVFDAYNLVNKLNEWKEIPIGDFNLAQRVQLMAAQDALEVKISMFGSVRSYNKETKLYSVVMDSGHVVMNLTDSDILVDLNIEQDLRLNYVSRIVLGNALTENRLPLGYDQIRDDLCPWEYFTPAFSLPEDDFTSLLWTKDRYLDVGVDSFPSFLYLLAEAIRGVIMNRVLLSLRVIEECNKQLIWFENKRVVDGGAGFVEGVANFVRLIPEAVLALGSYQDNSNAVSDVDSSSLLTGNGALSLIRHILSTQAIKVLRKAYRSPTQKDIGLDSKEFALDKSLLLQRLKYYVHMQKIAEDGLRSSGCLGVFGDGQSDWNAAWVFSCESNATAVCTALRRAIALTNKSQDNDFVAAKARYDLAGYIMMGGEGPQFNMNTIDTLRTQAVGFEASVECLDMSFYIAGESIMYGLVRQALVGYTPAAAGGGDLRVSRQLDTSKAKSPLHEVCACCYAAGAVSSVSTSPAVTAPLVVTAPLMLCSACKAVGYCSRECQKAHFKYHKVLCARLKK